MKGEEEPGKALWSEKSGATGIDGKLGKPEASKTSEVAKIPLQRTISKSPPS